MRFRRDDLVPRGQLDLVDTGILVGQLDGGVGDEDVEAAPLLCRAIDGGPDLGLDGAVGRQDEALAASLPDRGGHLLEEGLPSGDQGDPGPLGGEAERGRLADALARPGDQGPLAGEPILDDLHRTVLLPLMGRYASADPASTRT